MRCKIRRRRSAVLLVTIFLAAACFGADKKQLTDALAAVNANLKSPAGKQYDTLIGKEFSEKYLANTRQCKQSLPAGMTIEPFDMFLKLNARGKVQEALVYPETQFALCARSSLMQAKFSNPPHDAYWINIHMEFKH